MKKDNNNSIFLVKSVENCYFFLGHRQTEIRRRYTITNDARSKANEISTASLCCQVCMRRFDVYLSLFEIIWRENSNCCIFAGCMKS